MDRHRIGLWVEVLGEDPPARSKDGIRKLLSRAHSLGVNDIYFQVFRSGLCWCELPQYQQAPDLSFDPLAYLLSLSPDYAISVHAWINVFRVGDVVADGFAKSLNEKCFVLDNHGRRLKDYEQYTIEAKEHSSYYRIDTPGAWLEPTHPQVSEFYSKLISELCAKYKSLSGIHLDYFRYPYSVPMWPLPLGEESISFGEGNAELKRKRLSTFLEKLRACIRSNQILSVAAVPWVERAFLQAHQDWPQWSESGIVDRACLMSYTADMKKFRIMLRQANGYATEGKRIHAGIAGYELENWAGVEKQRELAEHFGFGGSVLFSYRNLLERGLLKE